MRLIGIAIGTLLFVAASAAPDLNAAANNEPSLSVALAFLDEVTEDGDAMCVSGKKYNGCCSKQGGIKDIRGVTIQCNDRSESPSCSGIQVDLSGCCSGNQGVARVDSKRRVMCANEQESRSCSITRTNKDECR